MRARRALEMDRCPGCGGWLSQTLTDDEPIDHQPDHFYAVEPLWCEKCVAHEQWREMNHEQDKRSAGTIADRRTSARRLVSERRPIPTT
jgi:uncharacterized protein with PIN domain